MTPVTLTIAGSDSSAGAGLQADLKTFQHFQTYGLTVATCVVSETPEVVRAVHPIPPPVLQDQLTLLLDAYPVAAIKTGMLLSKPHVVAVSEILADHTGIPLVVDPVMIATSGASLLEDDAIEAYRTRLLPSATLITPNLDEASVLVGSELHDEADMEAAARKLASDFGTAVLLKGGHLESAVCADLLCEGQELRWFRAPRIETPASHGTGCTLSAAITANLALGHELPETVERAKQYLNQTLAHALTLGTHHHLNQGTNTSIGTWNLELGP
ncbi:MAG: bifunctional hydroxymethylpyrimidine kinase/phosphomethylpyrimidine kinase [Verrucomicrobiota bacterium]